MPKILVMYVLATLGGFFYVSKIPERLFPGNVCVCVFSVHVWVGVFSVHVWVGVFSVHVWVCVFSVHV